MDLVGKVLGKRYEILKKIGVGGMATVYKARCNILNRYVAIKVLKDEFANDQEFIKRFQIEAQSAASLSHPNIVSIYDVSTEGDIHYIVMELIEGKSLKEIIKENERLSWKDSAKIASQIASGLATAHKNHIVHRDIKPHNIIMTKDGVAKITDFGIAKASTSGTINVKNSMGSVHYFSPEQARGGYTDEKTDIYSLGVVLYEMVTGQLPFDSDAAVKVAMMHLEQEAVKPKDIVPDIPEGLNKIIMKALEKDPINRYSSATQMYIDLQKIIKNPEETEVGIIKQNQSSNFATQKIPNINKGSYKAENQGRRTENTKTSHKKEKKQMGILSKILVALVCIFAVFGITVFGAVQAMKLFFGEKEKVPVPQVIGLSEEKAKKVIEEAGLVYNENARIRSDSMPKNYILTQTPLVDSKIAKGSKVNVDVSDGNSTLMENLIGKKYQEAKSIIQSSGIENRIIRIDQSSIKYDEDVVIDQDPEPNEELIENAIITLIVSAGNVSGEVEVPDFTNKTEIEAIEFAEENKLVADIKYFYVDNMDNGNIFYQKPKAGSILFSGDTISLMVCKLVLESGEHYADIKYEDITKAYEDTDEVDNTKTNVKKGYDPFDELIPVGTADSNNNEQKEQNNNNENNNQLDLTPTYDESRKVPISLDNISKKDTYNIRVEVEGDVTGTKIIHDATHTKDEKYLEVYVPNELSGLLRIVVYLDNAVKYEYTDRY